MHYACAVREDMAFAEMLAGHPRVRLHLDAEAGGRLDIGAICRAAPAGAHLYCCGPPPMLGAFEAATAERPRAQVHAESFGARQAAALEGGFDLPDHRCEVLSAEERQAGRTMMVCCGGSRSRRLVLDL